MNCDEAFEALTDPAGGRREDLHWHLGLCARCRELRETLAPALASLTELTEHAQGERPPGEGPPAGRSATLPPALRRRSLNFDEQPGVSDGAGRAVFLSDEAVRVAEESAARIGGAGRRRWSGVIQVAAGLLVGIGLAYAGLSTSLSTPAAAPAATPTADATDCLWLSKPRPADQAASPVVLSCVTCHLDAH